MQIIISTKYMDVPESYIVFGIITVFRMVGPIWGFTQDYQLLVLQEGEIRHVPVR